MLILVRKPCFAAYYDGQSVEIAETRGKGSAEKSGNRENGALVFVARLFAPKRGLEAATRLRTLENHRKSVSTQNLAKGSA